MKKIIFCLTAILVLTACNKKPNNQVNNEAAESETVRNEMPTATPEDEGQSEWLKQTTIMSAKPMLIDFYAEWCGPCKQLTPIIDELEKKYSGTVIFRRVDVDQEPELAQEFQVEAIPTLMFVTPKGEYQTMMGYREAPDIEAKISELLTRSAK